MPLLTIVFWALLIAVAVYLFRWMAGPDAPRSKKSGQDDLPLDVLKARYARGEIDRDEFERMKKDISDES